MNPASSMEATVRPAVTSDNGAIREVVVAAFSGSQFGHNGEAELVDQLSENCDNLISLVAVSGGVVGHILFSPVQIHASSASMTGAGLAPVTVLPAHQRTEIGSTLINTGITALQAQGCPFVVLIGNPQYYCRFGFESAGEFGLIHTFDDISQKCLMVNWLAPAVADSLIGGTVQYRDEFNF